MSNSDADASHQDIEHFAYFPTSQARADFIYRCLKAGFRLRNTSEPPEPGAGFGAILFHTTNDLDQASTTLTAFAAEYGGRYDGWERPA